MRHKTTGEEMAKAKKPRLDSSLSMRFEPEMAEELHQIARECGMKRATWMRKALLLALDEMAYYGSLEKLKAAWFTPEGAEHVQRVLRGLEKPRRVQ